MKNGKDLKEVDSSFHKASKALDEELRIFKETQKAEAIAYNQEFAVQQKQLDEQQKAELAGKGVDMDLLEQYRKTLTDLKNLLARIEDERPTVLRYRDAEKIFLPRNRKSKRG